MNKDHQDPEASKERSGRGECVALVVATVIVAPLALAAFLVLMVLSVLAGLLARLVHKVRLDPLASRELLDPPVHRDLQVIRERPDFLALLARRDRGERLVLLDPPDHPVSKGYADRKVTLDRWGQPVQWDHRAPRVIRDP